MDTNSLAHTKWECKYHIIFAPKYRRQVIYKEIKADVGQILGTLCRRKGIEIIEAECMLLSGKLNDVLSGRLFYADFDFPQGYQSL